MPLVIVTGYPCSGKTKTAEMLAEFCRAKGKSVSIVNNESLGVVRNEAYASPQAEKMCRGALKAAIERGTRKDTILIADDLNYIKGYRYELFCIARAEGTSCCTVHVDAPVDHVTSTNAQRSEGTCYSDQIVAELPVRYERPNDRNKWERPLFVVTPDDEQLPLQDILDVLEGQTLNPNMATVSTPVAAGNLLHEVDTKTNEIIAAIQQLQQQGGGGVAGAVKVDLPHCSKQVLLDRFVAIGVLRRIKRQFLKVMTDETSTPHPSSEIGDLFVDFMLSQIAQMD